MEERRTSQKGSRLDQFRKVLMGDRVEILERRIEILARNLGREVELARTEILRRLEPLEARMGELERRLEGGLLRERRHGDSARQQLATRSDEIATELKHAIAAAVKAREELRLRVRQQLDHIRELGNTECGQLEERLGRELESLRLEAKGDPVR